MAQITAKMVKDLRDKTNAGMMDCKKALVASDGDMEKALEHLRKSGIAKAAKKAGRSATEGRIVSAVSDNAGVMIEVLCETDFVARNEKFSTYANELVQRVLTDYASTGDVSDELLEKEKDAQVELVAVIGENIKTRRAIRWEGDSNFATYLHMGGKIGVLVEAKGECTPDMLTDICMHVAAFNPRFVSEDDVPADVLEKEHEIARAQVEGKPENIMDKIIAGKINKWYTEVCLTRQPWLRDDKTCLAKIVPNLTIERFARWVVGEDLDGESVEE